LQSRRSIRHTSSPQLFQWSSPIWAWSFLLLFSVQHFSSGSRVSMTWFIYQFKHFPVICSHEKSL
jgi:hypothetical protein